MDQLTLPNVNQRGKAKFSAIQEELSYENNKLKLSSIDRFDEDDKNEGQGNYITPMAF